MDNDTYWFYCATCNSKYVRDSITPLSDDEPQWKCACGTNLTLFGIIHGRHDEIGDETNE